MNRCKAGWSKMRREGKVPYDWIADSSRLGFHTTEYADTEDFINSVARLYRKTLWTPDTRLVEVWCESRSLRKCAA